MQLLSLAPTAEPVSELSGMEPILVTVHTNAQTAIIPPEPTGDLTVSKELRELNTALFGRLFAALFLNLVLARQHQHPIFTVPGSVEV